MKAVRRAVIDVGTNSIKLLVAEVGGPDVQPLLEQSKQTRLGQGFYRTHVLQHGPIAQTAQAIADFAAKARDLGAESPLVIATSAVREARNRAELTSAVEQESGLPVRVLSGEEEASYGFKGVSSDARLAQESLMLLDVGGGSTEFILGKHRRMLFGTSFQIGTVRLLEQLQLADPPTAENLNACREWLRRAFAAEVEPQLGPLFRQELSRHAPGEQLLLVGTGGTASILGCMEIPLTSFDRARLEAVRLSRDRLHWHLRHLWSLPGAGRREVIGLPPNRADVILTGTAIFEAVMEHFGFQEMRISTRGLRFGLLLTES